MADRARTRRQPDPAPAVVDTSVAIEIERAGLEPVGSEVITFSGLLDGEEHLALRFSATEPHEVPLVRIHSECLTGDVFGSQRCDCGAQLTESVGLLAEQGGVILYLRQEGRGIGLYNKLRAYRLQDDGLDTFAANRALGYGADERDYAVAAQMLLALDLPRIRLLTNNPDKVASLRQQDIDVVSHVPTGTFRTPQNTSYLRSKMLAGHSIREDMFRD